MAFAALMWLVSACGINERKCFGEHKFTDEVRLSSTPVKQQGASSLCWIYGMLATIETEHISLGDSVNLSADYLVRMFISDEARRYWLSERKNGISTRGVASMTLDLMRRYGAMPFDSYHAEGVVNYDAFARRLQLVAKASPTFTKFNERMDDAFDRTIDYLPKAVFMLGARYMPLEFGHSVCRDDEYIGFTSYSNEHFYKPVEFLSPDNRRGDEYLNLPIDTLMSIMETALRNGHAVCWEGDTSEPGFSFADGITVFGNEDRQYTQQDRQREFDRHRTTDDHVMALVGIAHDEKGRKYFIAKNSWGTANRFHGYMYLSFNYVKMKTCCVIVSREAVGW